MPFLRRRQIAEGVREAANRKYRSQLRKTLQNPALTPEQRQDLRSRLRRVGEPRVYDANSPPPPGALEVVGRSTGGSSPAPRYSFDALRGMKKAELVALAEEHGVSTSGTKATLVERLSEV